MDVKWMLRQTKYPQIVIICFADCSVVFGTSCLTCDTNECKSCASDKYLDDADTNPACSGNESSLHFIVSWLKIIFWPWCTIFYNIDFSN